MSVVLICRVFRSADRLFIVAPTADKLPLSDGGFENQSRG